MLSLLLLLSLVLTASTQLAPVYNPGGGPPAQETIVARAPAVLAPKLHHPAAAHLPRSSYVTKTVYGFLDFTTTVGSTVMIFTPQSQGAKPSPSKTKDSPLPPQSSRFTLPPSKPRVNPTPAIPRVIATPAPSTKPPRLPAFTSTALESSFFEPQTALAIETLFSVTPDEYYDEEVDYVVESSPVQEYPDETIIEVEEPITDPPSPTSPRKPFRRPQKLSPDNQRRPDLNYFANRKKPSPVRRPQGGSTIVPIIIEGTGTISPKPTIIEAQLKSSVPTIPSEVVVTATQGFAAISVIGPFSTAVNNELGQVSEHYDYLASEPALDVEETYDVYDVEPTASLEDLYSAGLVTSDSSFPTGLVTKLGGTIVLDGLTTVHETSVIGTYIAGQYAQILQSTSHIFQITPTPELKLSSPSQTQAFEKVQSVIKGSATQFITPESTAALPLESLFSEPVSRGRENGRKVNEESLIQMRLQSALSKRRGAHHELAGRLRSHTVNDPYVDLEEEHDLQRAGSNPRASFRFQGATSVRPTQPVSTFYAQEIQPTTFRRTFKPSASRRLGNNRHATTRPGPPGQLRPGRNGNRWRLNTSPRPKISVNRRPITPANKIEKQIVEESNSDPVYHPDSDIPGANAAQEETLRVVTSTPADGATDVYYELATIRSLHTFRVGTTKNTRYVTFTKTFSHYLSATPSPALSQDELYETQLFENILDDGPRDISTLPPVDIGENDISAILETVTETFSTTELMMKTSVLPVLRGGETSYYSLTQSYHITRVVTAIKTMPPYEAFAFIPENSLNEFNDQLLAEGTETGQSLRPEELEYDENGEVVDTTTGTRVRPPPGFPFQDPNLAELAGGPFNPDVFEKQVNPQLVAALQQRQQLQQQQIAAKPPYLSPGQQAAPLNPAVATPGLSPEQLQQLAYLRLLNPYSFGGFPQMQPQQHTTVTSSPVTITTDITTTSTRVLRVIFNARPIFTTLSSVEVVHTTLTTYTTETITVSPQLSPFSFPFPAAPFPVG